MFSCCKSNSRVNPKDLYCFAGVDRTRCGLVGLKYIWFDGSEKYGHVNAP